MRSSLLHVVQGRIRCERFPRLRRLHITVFEEYFYEGSAPTIVPIDGERDCRVWQEKVGNLEEEFAMARLTDQEGPFQVMKKYSGMNILWSVKPEARDCNDDRASFNPDFLQNMNSAGVVPVYDVAKGSRD